MLEILQLIAQALTRQMLFIKCMFGVRKSCIYRLSRNGCDIFKHTLTGSQEKEIKVL